MPSARPEGLRSGYPLRGATSNADCISLYDVNCRLSRLKRLDEQTHGHVLAGQIEGVGLGVVCMVGRGGLEPPTSRLSGVRSNHLSYRPGLHKAPKPFNPGPLHMPAILGGAYRDRTDDPLLAKQMLSQLS